MPSTSVRPLDDTLKEYGRGVVGGLIFAIAPLYTMEVWWQGFIAPVEYILVGVIVTLLALMAYAHYAGLHADRDLRHLPFEALETLALGFLVAFIVLKLVGQLSPLLSFREAITRLTLEGLTTSIGVAVGSAQLGQKPSEQGDDASDGGDASDGEKDHENRARADEEIDKKKRGLIHDFAYSVLGATIIIAGVSPTLEIVVIAVEAPPLAVLGTAVVSFVLALGVVSYFDFRGAQQLNGSIYAGGPLGDAAVTYAIGLIASAMLLWMAGRFADFGFAPCLYMTVYLALPATVGASVGRLLL